LSVIAETAYKKYSPRIEEWTSENIKKLGKFLVGLPTKVFSQFSEEAFTKR